MAGEEASIAGHGQEARNGLYMPWPQSGRMQCEENKKKTCFREKEMERGVRAVQEAGAG
jgi:hypothetical protein